jgi:hypothetical protein
LPVHYIFHAITTDRQRGVSATNLTIRSIARNVFKRCEDFGVKKICVPSFADSAETVGADRSTRLFVEALAEHLSQPTQLQDVAFCIPDTHHREALISSLEADLIGSVPDRAAARLSVRRSRETGDLSSDVVEGQWSIPLGASPVPSQSLVSAIGSAIRRWRSRRPVAELPKSAGLEPEAAPTSPSVVTRTVIPHEDGASVEHAGTTRNRPVLHQRYVLLEEVGRGGMGIVHLAWDLVLRQTVAIKTLRPSTGLSARHIERLRQEAALQMRLTHTGIVRLFHFEPNGASAGPFLVMEYVPWLTAEQWIAESGSEGLPPRVVLHVGERLCDALASAHDAGVLHLDIKPSNVFVDPAAEQPKLADFGIATSLGPTRSDVLVTRLVGTPAYMAPEQTIRGAKIGPWTDVYLLAGTLWELITGRKASEPNDCVEPETVAALAVLRKGLAESTEQRPRNVKAFQSLLAAAYNDPMPA